VSVDGRRGPASRHLDVAETSADLGLPVPRGTRFRLIKRALGRIVWIFGRHQATYNHAMLEAVRDLASSVEHIGTAIPEQVGNEVGSMRSQVGSLEVEVRTTTGRAEAMAGQLEELRARLEELRCRLDAVETTQTR
jgi:hypothetical protein